MDLRKKRAEVLILRDGGRNVGFALFFHNFSTFLGKSGIYLEDLFVLPECRGQGLRQGHPEGTGEDRG